MIQTSVIIPSRSPDYLQKTIDDLLQKSEGSIEIIVVLDGYWPDPMINPDPRVILVHHGSIHNNYGMRASINAGMAIAKGEYVMKIDEHCMMDQGWDVKLAADCEDNWVCIPRRYRLDAENWTIIHDGRPPVDYMYLTYPYERPYDWKCGLRGFEWRQRHLDRKDIMIDDTMSWQGSCYFMKKKHWEWLGGMSEEGYGKFTHEAQEIGNKTWLGGGRLIVNKNTWYAHYHKGARGKRYGFSNAQYAAHQAEKEIGRRYCIDYWINNKWSECVHDFEWLLDKFAPIPGWPEDWRERIKEDEKTDFSHINEKPTGIS